VAYIVTCYHVISGYTSQVYILLSDSTIPIKAETVNYSSLNDIAVLRVESSQLSASNCRAADVADSSLVTMGETAHAVGNPLNADFRSSTGTVTNPEGLVGVGSTVYRVIGVDTPINPGNSGGGLFNSKGELIGIVNAKTQLVEIDNMAYAIPSNLAISLANNIVKNNYPVKAVLGCSFTVKAGIIQTEIVDGREIADYEVLVSSVQSGSAADIAGFQINDEIVSFAYKNTVVKCRSQYTFADHAFNLSVGDQITFVIRRGGTEKQLTVTISKVVAADAI
jgi:serine protease Do